MKINQRKSVFDKLKKYTYSGVDSDFIEITEWDNGEGYDITINNRIFSLSDGELDAINYLVNVLRYEK